MLKKKELRKELIKIGKRIVSEHLAIDTGGNISVRRGNTMFIKAAKTPFNSGSINSYVSVDLKTGKCKKGTPSSEKYMHIACYKRRLNIDTVLHLHPVFSTAVANSRIKLGPISYELSASLNSELVRAKYKPSGSQALAKEISKLISRCNAILMPNHGIIVVGKGLEKTLGRALAVERACKTLIFSRLLGLSSFLPKKEAMRIAKIYDKY